MATLGPDTPDGVVLMREADEALRRAKAGGRNRVSWSGGDHHPGVPHEEPPTDRVCPAVNGIPDVGGTGPSLCLQLLGPDCGHLDRGWMFTGPFEVGRQRGCFLADAGETSVSRRHAAVFPDDAGWWVADRGSTNGTYLNGTRLGEQPAGPLRAGDIVQFGNVACSVESAAPRGDAGPTG
jgi:hypothetical protein